jgi:phosphoglycerate dehydrogenase-like enzyme
MKLLILVHHRFDLWNVPSWFTEKLAAEFPEVEVVCLNNYEGAEEHLRNAEIVFTISLRPEQFRLARQLRWIHAPTAAVHQLLFPELVNSDVILTNSTDVHGPVVAEHVIALIFALAKKIPQAVRFQHQAVWGQDAIWNDGSRPREISGATLGLIGVGGIGREVARKAAALGMRVIAVREHPEKGKPEGVSEVFSPAQLDDVLRQADYVVVAAPLIPATEGLINAARLAVMKPDAYLINVGRGPQVEEAALAEALCTRRIAGAALDVFNKEPLPAESPFWRLENLLITPHTAGLTEKLWHRHYELFSENLRRYTGHQPLRFVVNKQRGY